MNWKKLIRQISPAATSLFLLGWLVWRISPRALASAAAELDWKLLVPATIVMVLSLYLWDPVCFPVVYRVGNHRWNYWQALHLRGLSYIVGAFHYEIGQAALAWGFARVQQTSVARMLSRTVVLIYHDILVLLMMGAVGAIASGDEQVRRIRPLIALGLFATFAVGLVFWSFASKQWLRVRQNGSASLLQDWSIRRSLQLIPLRICYFLIFVVYAAVALRICRLPVDHRVVLGSIPLVLLADGLPSVSGLGTRDTALQLLIKTARPDTLLAFSLIWSTGLIIGRSAIGLAHLWVDRFLRRPVIDSSLKE
jgi:Lysylphosphatidylglycerol synthase TM region